MGFFSKVKSSLVTPEQEAIKPAAKAGVALHADVAKLVTVLGGTDNVLDMRAIAHSRVRIELASPINIKVADLPTAFVAVHKIDSNLLHVIAAKDVANLGLPGVR